MQRAVRDCVAGDELRGVWGAALSSRHSGMRHLAQARNPLIHQLCRPMDSGLALRAPRNDGKLPVGRARRSLGEAGANHHFRFSETMSSEKSAEIENISVFQNPNRRYITSIPSRQEGRIMIAVIVGRVAVDAGSADSERHESVR